MTAPVLAIDPGTTNSALVHLYDDQVEAVGYLPNEDVLTTLRAGPWKPETVLAIEMVASYGMPVGREVFETVLWIGRFLQLWQPSRADLVYRREVKMHLCGSARAKDPNVRQALLDRFGPGREKAVGTKSAPGPLYRISGDLWAALAVAVTWADREAGRLV